MSGKASGITQSNSEGLRIKRAYSVNHTLRPIKNDMTCPRSVCEAGNKRGGFLSPLPFISLRPSTDRVMLTSLERAIY